MFQRLQPTGLPLDETSSPLSPFGRIRSDLLVVLLTGLHERQALRDAADRIRRAFAEPLVDGDKTFQLRPTLGLARFPDDGALGQALPESARAALATARQSDNDSTVVFSSRTMPLPIIDLPDFAQELRWALEMVSSHRLGRAEQGCVSDPRPQPGRSPALAILG